MDLLIKPSGCVKFLICKDLLSFIHLIQAMEVSELSILKLIFLLQVWQMVRRKLELTEVIATKESIQKVDTYGKMIFAITQGHRMKVIPEETMITTLMLYDSCDT